MELPKTLTDIPTSDKSFAFGSPSLQTPHQVRPPMVVAGMVSDSDGDGVPDPWDCQPFNPDEDGLWGDLIAGARRRIQTARAYVRPDYGRAARRRQAVRQRVSGGARQVSRTVTKAITRRVRPAVRHVKRTVSRLPIHPSASRAVERRGAIAKKFGVDLGRAAERRAAVAAGVSGAVAKLGIDFERAKERREAVMAAGVMGAPKQMLAGISDAGAPLREKMESQIARVTARQQQKFDAPGAMSGLATGFYEKAARVATVARRFETQDQVAHVPRVLQRLGAPEQFVVPGVEPAMQRTEKRLGLQSERIPAPLRTAGWAVKEFGYGVAFGGPAMAVEMAGMIPVGVEAMARRPEIIPAAVAVGAVEMGRGMWHGAKTSPTRMAGEFATFGAIMKGGSRVVDPFTPQIIRGKGYTGLGIKGRTKPVYDTVKVPKIARGGVLEVGVIAKPQLVPKKIITGYTQTPKPLVGLRTAKVTTPEGVITTYKGIQIGKGWTPAEIIKTHKMESVTGIEGTELAMERQTQARLGQFRYERTGFARGHIDPGYFLPKGKTISKPQGFPELMTGERGLTVTGRHLPSVDVIKPPPLPKPTRVYAEIKQPYVKAADMPLAGSPAHIRWIEAGFRKVSYGVKGGPKQPRIEIAAEPWGYHPTYPPGIAGGTAAVPSYLTGYTPKRIATGMYFHPEGAVSSRVATIADILRPKTTGIRPPKVSARPARPKPVSPRAEPVRAAEPMRGPAPEPARPRPIVGVPEPMLAPKPAPVTPKRRVTFAEPEASPVLEAMLKDAKTAGTAVMQTGASCPIFDSPRVAAPSPTTVPARPPTTAETLARPRTATEMLAQTRVPVDAYIPKTERTTTTRRKPKPIYRDTVEPRTTPIHVPAFVPAPVESEEEKERRRWFIMHTPDPSTKPVPASYPEPYPDPYLDPHPTPEPQPEPEPEPEPTPKPSEWRVPPPPTKPGKITDPPPPPPIILKPDRKDKKKPRRRKTPGKRKPFEWYLEHELVTLGSFIGDAGKAPPPQKFPEPDLGTPKP